MASSPHGARPLRGLESTAQSSISSAKFGRMFRWIEPAQRSDNAREAQEIEDTMLRLAELMIPAEFADNVKGGKFTDRGQELKPPQTIANTPDAPLNLREPADENPTIAAGYTYFGQFIDHDITFDPASFLQQINDPNALEDFRTPRFDLDCLYGRGPADQPYLYDGSRFALGKQIGNGGQGHNDFDVPRRSLAKDTKKKPALIGDKRNDENKIVSQIQSLFLQFHNRVVEKVEKSMPDADAGEVFAEAQRVVRWTYQWLVINDFLKKICDNEVFDSIDPKAATPSSLKPSHAGPKLNFYKPHEDAYIPVEFAVAAYRFGHSMVRPSYALNGVAKSTAQFKPEGKPAVDFARIPIFVGRSGDNRDAMNGFGEELPNQWGIDWSFFFGTPNTHADGKKQIPQPSYRIDTKLVDPLRVLPEFFSRTVGTNPKPQLASLSFRNLMRGVSMGLPSGERVAAMMGLAPLKPSDIWEKTLEVGAKGGDIQEWKQGKSFMKDLANAKWMKGATPLWFYILKEAEIQKKGTSLGKIGSTIVAETFFGLMWEDHFSYLFQMPNWSPAEEDDMVPGIKNIKDMLSLTDFATTAPATV